MLEQAVQSERSSNPLRTSRVPALRVASNVGRFTVELVKLRVAWNMGCLQDGKRAPARDGTWSGRMRR